MKYIKLFEQYLTEGKLNKKDVAYQLSIDYSGNTKPKITKFNNKGMTVFYGYKVNPDDVIASLNKLEPSLKVKHKEWNDIMTGGGTHTFIFEAKVNEINSKKFKDFKSKYVATPPRWATAVAQEKDGKWFYYENEPVVTPSGMKSTGRKLDMDFQGDPKTWNKKPHSFFVANGRVTEGKVNKFLKEEIFINEEDTYTDYPEAAKKNAKKAIEWKEKYGRDEVTAATRVGWARAHQLAGGEALSADTVKRMAAFNRHRKNSKISPKHKDTPWKDNGYVAWLTWGGDEGVDWAMRQSEKMDKS